MFDAKRTKDRHRRLSPVVALLLAVLALPAGAADAPLTGAVTDREGRPVAGARVELHEPLPPWRELGTLLAGEPAAEPRATTRTDADGRFDLAAPRGLWWLRVAGPGLLPEALLVPLDGEPLEREPVVLDEAASLIVTVGDERGRPLAGALLASRPDGQSAVHGFAGDRFTWTDDDGRGRVRRRPRERLFVAAALPGFVPQEIAVVPGIGDATIRLTPGVARTIEVRDGRRRPIAGALVATADSGLPLGLTGEDGRLELWTPERGELRIEVVAAAGRASTGIASPRRLAGSRSEDSEPPPPAVVVLDPSPRLAGRVVAEADGGAIAGAVVWQSARGDLQTVSGAEGEFALVVEPAVGFGGDVFLRAAAAGHHPTWRRLASEAAEVVILLAPTAGVEGRVVDESGEPVAGATLVARGPQVWGSGRPAVTGRASSGLDGTFRLARLEPGLVHQVLVEHPAFPPVETELVAPGEGAPADALEIVLRRGSRAIGTVLDASGRPLPGATASARPTRSGDFSSWPWMPSRGASPRPPEATADEEGRFVLEPLRPGRYDLVVRAAGHAGVRVPGVEVPEPPAVGDFGTVHLEPGVELAGRVVDTAARPVVGASVQARGEEMHRFAGRDDDLTGQDGRFVLRDLASGTMLDLQVEAPGYVSRTVEGIAVPAAEPLIVELERAATVAGRVVDALASGVPGASVRGAPVDRSGSAWAGAREVSARADEEGRFELEGLAPGRVRLFANAEGHVASPAVLLELAPGEKRDGVRLEVGAGGVISGRVVGPGGEPVQDATVHAARGGAWLAWKRSDEAGRFRLEGIAEGVVEVRADRDGLVPAVREVRVGGGEVEIELVLGEGHPVSGRVLDESGMPLAAVDLMLAGAGFPMPTIRSGDAGTFRFEAVAPGTWQVMARKEGLVQAGETPRLVVTGPLSGVEVRMTTSAAIVGRVSGVEPSEIARLEVVAAPELPQAVPQQGVVDSDGGYRIEGVGPGPWRVVAGLGGSAAGGGVSGRVEVHPGEREVRLDLELGGTAVVSGRLTLGDEPLAGALVLLVGSSAASFGQTRTAADGSFRVERLALGTYELTVDDPRSGLHHRRQIEVDGDRDLAIELATGEVAGRVVDAETGAPLADAEVHLEHQPGGPSRNLARTRSADPDGSFRLRRVTSGRHRLSVRLPGYATASLDVLVPSEGSVEGAVLEMTPAAGAVLEVTTVGGAPPGFVSLAALAPGAAVPAPGDLTIPAIASGHQRAGEAGRVRIEGLPAGRWTVLVAADGWAVETVGVLVPGPPVPVRLAHQAIVDVTVAALVSAYEEGSVRLVGGDGRPLLVPGDGAAQSGWDLRFGRARIEHVPAGAWTVEVTSGDGTTRSRAVSVEAGAVNVVVLD